MVSSESQERKKDTQQTLVHAGNDERYNVTIFIKKMKTLQKQDTYDPERIIKTLNPFDMWALGITIVIGGQYFGWNSILVHGAGIGAMAACTVAIGYICLVYCVSEVSSGLPFAGMNFHQF